MNEELEIVKAINWWEKNITPEQREKYLEGTVWTGTVNERHQKLLRFFRDWKKKQR